MDERNNWGMGMDGRPGGDQDKNLWKSNTEPWNRQEWSPTAGAYGGQEDERPETRNHMALASVAMGCFGLVTSWCFLPGLVFGGLAIIFARLSKVEERMSGLALAGLITGLIGMIAGVVFLMILNLENI